MGRSEAGAPGLRAAARSPQPAVAALSREPAVLGLLAALLAGPGALVRTVCAICAFIIALVVWLYVFWRNPNLHHRRDDSKTEQK